MKLEGTYRYSSVGDEHLTIYVESSNNSTASFYIDDISFVSTGSGSIDIERDLVPIKDMYEDYFLIGNAVSASEFEGTRLELLKMHHNLVTAENAMKPSYAYNDNREFDFSAQDELVQKALNEDFQVHGHVLVWHQQSEDWQHSDENGNPLSREEALENLRHHVQTVVEHFGTNVISWDVVNEAMIDNPPNPDDWRASLRQSGWYRAIGDDYVEQAFLAAKEVIDENGWDIKLYYNDYNDDNQNKAEAIYQMVKEINEKYATEYNGQRLIDGIGMQGHYNLNTNPENVRRSMEKFISLGVEVGVTELDITAGSNNELTEQEENAQAYLYAQLFQLYKEHAEHISRVTFWGLNDATSWRAAQSPLLFDRDMQAKLAYYAVIDPEGFIAEHAPEEREAKQGKAIFGTPVINGEIDEVWQGAEELPVSRYQMAWQGADGVAKALWDHENLYVLIQVSDSELDKSSPNPWEQDSIEVFVDENNEKTSFYQEDDGQFRVNFDNDTSFNPERIAEGFESATRVTGSGYVVEVKIPFRTITPEHLTKIGFDVQINDGKDGARQSIATWNDTTGQAFQDTSVFGVLTLVDPEMEDPGSEDPGNGKVGDGDRGDGESGDGEIGDGDSEDGEAGDGDPRRGNTGSGDSDNLDGNNNGSKQDGTSEDKLPETATNVYTILLIGVLLIVAGAITYLVVRRKVVTTNA
ncbi:endo-1,4-beta-xylanase [Bacillus sp. JCM 19034]|uniref:endo-1,4-beta-xylanase n=1 Tax=Bacillus sp. JCM 19034 TaxID=1481928 RepID=UPI000AD34E47